MLLTCHPLISLSPTPPTVWRRRSGRLHSRSSSPWRIVRQLVANYNPDNTRTPIRNTAERRSRCESCLIPELITSTIILDARRRAQLLPGSGNAYPPLLCTTLLRVRRHLFGDGTGLDLQSGLGTAEGPSHRSDGPEPHQRGSGDISR